MGYLSLQQGDHKSYRSYLIAGPVEKWKMGLSALNMFIGQCFSPLGM